MQVPLDKSKESSFLIPKLDLPHARSDLFDWGCPSAVRLGFRIHIQANALTSLDSYDFGVVNDNFQVAASTQSASVNSATNIFIVPEPMTSVFLGSGLLAIGLLLRRKRA